MAYIFGWYKERRKYEVMLCMLLGRAFTSAVCFETLLEKI
jgi:hypothetical protein